jgi:hypothetical protein
LTGQKSRPEIPFSQKWCALSFPPVILKLDPASNSFQSSLHIIFIAKMNSHIYSPLEDKSENGSQPSEDSERLLGSDSEAVYRKPCRKIPIWIPIVLIPLISLCLVGFGAWIGSRWLINIDAVCLAHVQHYCEFRHATKMTS